MTLCGAFALEPRDSDAPLPGGQARQVLTYLAARSGRLIRREVLSEVLWPRAGSAPQDPDAVLSSLLSRLRPVIAPARIESSGGGVGLLLPEGSSVDVEVAAAALEEARRALAAGDGHAAGAAAARALKIAEAGFLPEQEDDWTAGPRELVQTLRLDALECEANAAVLLGGAPLAAGEQAARIAVVLAPLRESAHAALMRVLAARGNTAEALRVYEGLRRLLMEELGVAPSPELRGLHERLVSDDEGVTPRVLLAEVLGSGNGGTPEHAAAAGGGTALAAPPAPAAPAPASWERPPLPPVVRALGSGEPAGREVALRLLHRSVARVREDGPRAAVILGDPGMGTSRLACVFARQLYDDGAYVLFGRAEPGSGGGATALREAFAPLARRRRLGRREMACGGRRGRRGTVGAGAARRLRAGRRGRARAVRRRRDRRRRIARCRQRAAAAARAGSARHAAAARPHRDDARAARRLGDVARARPPASGRPPRRRRARRPRRRRRRRARRRGAARRAAAARPGALRLRRRPPGARARGGRGAARPRRPARRAADRGSADAARERRGAAGTVERAGAARRPRGRRARRRGAGRRRSRSCWSCRASR